MAKRVGAKSRNTIKKSVLKQLNEGSLETATLSEALAIDFSFLMASAFPQVGEDAITQMAQANGLGITKRMDLAASLFTKNLGGDVFETLRHHNADTVRGWAAFVLQRNDTLSLDEKLTRMRPLADDPHFGVREWAWLAVRPSICDQIKHALDLLQPWTQEASENLRRFAIESTRPRGVWAKHIPQLKALPEIGESLLDQVMLDPSRYVQNACANWLNDAGKTAPKWVVYYCDKWRTRNTSKATIYITRRALRNLQ